ncbi:hypothetical protein HMPREF9057_02246, partial [Actinomyces sp. oral taxon 171 str. F0337]
MSLVVGLMAARLRPSWAREPGPSRYSRLWYPPSTGRSPRRLRAAGPADAPTPCPTSTSH